MPSAVEARSLASLLAAANSPPLDISTLSTSYLTSTEPLVLYIARVPGSKGTTILPSILAKLMSAPDIFLTPLKPKSKVVSAPDVESSLYYCHVDTAEDDEIRSQLSSSGSYQEPLRPLSAENPPLSNPGESELARRRRESQQKQLPSPSLEQPCALNSLPYPDSASMPDPWAGPKSSQQLVSQPVLSPGNGHLNPFPQDRGSLENAPLKSASSIKRKPVGSTLAFQASIPSALARSSSPRKVLGPRPMLPPRPTLESVSGLGQMKPLARSPGKENVRLQPWSDEEAVVGGKIESRKRDGGREMGRMTEGFERLNPYSNHSPYEGTNGKSVNIEGAGSTGKTISITIIRRDPGSGEQWNVGRLKVLTGKTSTQTSKRHSTSGDTNLEGGSDGEGVLLEISNEGYEKFVSKDSESQRQQTSNSTEDVPASGAPFQRWLNFAPPKSTASTSMSYDPAGATQRNSLRSSIDFSTHSHRSSVQQASFSHLALSTASFKSTYGPPASTSLSNTLERQQTPFTFLTPWSTPCAFTTSLAGKSLKCRHFPSYSNASSFSSTTRRTKDEGSQISELRFNLPATPLPPKSKQPSVRKRPGLLNSVSSSTTVARSTLSARENAAPALPPRPISQEDHSQFQRYQTSRYGHARAESHDASAASSSSSFPHPYNDEQQHFPPLPPYMAELDHDEPEDEFNAVQGEGERDERMDLSLGQELAGGGFWGKKAKLGKLIVEREGLAMLDLVVAANMGVWWWVGAGRERD